MALLEILYHPDPILGCSAEPITEISDELRTLAADMAETMYAAPGVGLAANQVGILKQIVVIDTEYPDNKPNLIVLVNPEIIEKAGTITWEEGCLSFPDIHEDVVRSDRVTVRALNRDGIQFQIEAEGLLAVAMQHEIDHLDGVLLIDHVSFLKKRIISRQLQKSKRAK